MLVCPRRPHQRLTDLALAEVTDLFATVQRVQHMLARHYFPAPPPQPPPPPPSSSSPPSSGTAPPPPPPRGGAFNIALQDGPEAGQTVAHVHVHVIPRVRRGFGAAGAGGEGSAKPDDGTVGDELYVRMAGEEGNVGGALWDRQRPRPGGAFGAIEEAERGARGMGEMEAEAGVYRALLEAEEREKQRE